MERFMAKKAELEAKIEAYRDERLTDIKEARCSPLQCFS